MHWLMSAIWGALPSLVPPEDSEAKARREAELRRRFERLSEEVDVIQRTSPDEDHRA